MPLTCIRCAPMVPAARCPAAISTSLAGRRHLSRRLDPSSGSDRARRWSRANRRRRRRRAPRRRCGSKVAGSRPKPMRSKISSGELRDDMSANSSISRWSRRRCNEVRTSGSASVMKPGLDPVLCSDDPPLRAGRLNPATGLRVEPCRVVELAARRHHVRARSRAAGTARPRRPGRPCRGRSPVGGRGSPPRPAWPRTPVGAQAAQLSGVASGLVLRIDVEPDEVEVRMLYDGPQGT